MTHGTSHAYNKLGCRCDECRDWKRGANSQTRTAVTPMRLKSIDMNRFARVCAYADSHCLTLKQAAKELGCFGGAGIDRSAATTSPALQ